jgi:hypothetical protein
LFFLSIKAAAALVSHQIGGLLRAQLLRSSGFARMSPRGDIQAYEALVRKKKQQPHMHHFRLARLLSVSTAYPCTTLFPTVVAMSIAERKLLLKGARIGGPFTTGSRFYLRHAKDLKKRIIVYDLPYNDVPKAVGPQSIWDFMLLHSIFFDHPVLRGFVSMIVRYLPYEDYSSSELEKSAAIKKEISAAIGYGFSDQTLDYTFLWTVDRQSTTPYYHGIAYRSVQEDIRKALRGAVKGLKHKPILPRTGKKLIPNRQDYALEAIEKRVGFPIRTLGDVERVYAESEILLGGVTVMKSVWRGNDLKPRIYYARGPTVHHGSPFIQTLFNAFVDSLANTHRKTRFHTRDMMLTSHEILFIYDYSSFTSNLHEIRRFTDALACAFDGVLITVVDVVDGPKQMDAGELLRDYNRHCNEDPTFDVSELSAVEEAVLNHNCGMLGVPGNISSCTLLHGIHLAVITGALLRCKVVGDDAMGLMTQEPGDRETLLEAIGVLGAVAEEKMEFWSDEGLDTNEDIGQRWDYCKRTVNRWGNRVMIGDLIDWPPINILFQILNPHHRFVPMDQYSRERTVSVQHPRFLMAIAPYDVDDSIEGFVSRYMRLAYKELGWHPRGGKSMIMERYYPPAFQFRFDYSEWLSSYGNGVIRRPKRYCPLVSEFTMQARVEPGAEFVAFPEPVLALGVRLGWLEDVTEYEYVRIDSFGDDLLSEIRSSRVYHLYQFTVFSPRPWFKQLVAPLMYPVGEDSGVI